MIASKMNLAMKKIDAVTKGGKNSAQNYAYVKATDVANEVRRALSEVGISFSYEVLSERHWESQTKSGTPQFYCSLHVKGTFHDSEDGTAMVSSGIGWGADTQDKAPYKAMTGALKYILRHTFIIPDEMDPENDKNEPQENSPRPKKITKSQADSLRALVSEKKKNSEDGEAYVKQVGSALKDMGYSSFGEITEDRFEDVKATIEGV